MNKKTNLLVGIGSALTVLTCALIFTISANTNHSANSDVKTAINSVQQNRIKVDFSDEMVSDEKLKTLSDIIVKGTVNKLKEKTMKSGNTTSSNGEKFTTSVPVALYDIKVTEAIKGSGNTPKELELALTDPSMDLEVGQEYTFVLYKIKGDSELLGSYALVSYSQGLYKLNESTQELVSIKTKEKISFEEFKNKFKDK